MNSFSKPKIHLIDIWRFPYLANFCIIAIFVLRIILISEQMKGYHLVICQSIKPL